LISIILYPYRITQRPSFLRGAFDVISGYPKVIRQAKGPLSGAKVCLIFSIVSSEKFGPIIQVPSPLSAAERQKFYADAPIDITIVTFSGS